MRERQLPELHNLGTPLSAKFKVEFSLEELFLSVFFIPPPENLHQFVYKYLKNQTACALQKLIRMGDSNIPALFHLHIISVHYPGHIAVSAEQLSHNHGSHSLKQDVFWHCQPLWFTVRMKCVSLRLPQQGLTKLKENILRENRGIYCSYTFFPNVCL